MTGNLLKKIIFLTWECINKYDKRLLEKAALNEIEFPLGYLLYNMFNSTHSEINIVTTNYDRAAEYSCNSMGLLFQTGFAPGYVQKWESSERIKFRHGSKPSRVVNIWKVHGSLDWFRSNDDRIVGLPTFELPSKNFMPLIVTPGLNKYERTHEDPFRTIIYEADKSLESASAFLCVGYGFRDQHIHPKIIERCRKQNVPIVVLARTLTKEAKNFLNNKAGQKYMGIEKYKKYSRVYTPDQPDGFVIKSPNLWSLPNFNNFIS